VSGAPWTAEEDARLRARYPRARSLAPLLPLFPGRTACAVFHRARALGLYTARTWTRAEVATLRDGWHEYGPRGLKARLPGRTWFAIRQKAEALGLPSGVPQGCESLYACAQRTGFHLATLRRVLAAGGVRVRVRYPAARSGARHHYHYVERDEADAAVAAWLATETVRSAAKARGMHPSSLRHVLLRSGVTTLGPKGFALRVPSAAIDAALAAWRKRLARKEAA
jgi:hypothetical protein